MKIKQGTILNVSHSRKGNFVGIATKDFDTDTTEFYPIALARHQAVDGLITKDKWIEGEEIPCRKSLCMVTVK